MSDDKFSEYAGFFNISGRLGSCSKNSGTAKFCQCFQFFYLWSFSIRKLSMEVDFIARKEPLSSRSKFAALYRGSQSLAVSFDFIGLLGEICLIPDAVKNPLE